VKKYDYPSSRLLEQKIHTSKGVAGLANGSNIERLLRELETDGSEVGAAFLELNALVNYVTQTEKLRLEIKTHAEFITYKLGE
jgi:hypothetical protein